MTNCTLAFEGGQEGVSAYAEFRTRSRIGIFIVSNMRNGYVYPGDRIYALVREIAREWGGRVAIRSDIYFVPSVKNTGP